MVRLPHSLQPSALPCSRVKTAAWRIQEKHLKCLQGRSSIFPCSGELRQEQHRCCGDITWLPACDIARLPACAPPRCIAIFRSCDDSCPELSCTESSCNNSNERKRRRLHQERRRHERKRWQHERKRQWQKERRRQWQKRRRQQAAGAEAARAVAALHQEQRGQEEQQAQRLLKSNHYIVELWSVLSIY